MHVRGFGRATSTSAAGIRLDPDLHHRKPSSAERAIGQIMTVAKDVAVYNL